MSGGLGALAVKDFQEHVTMDDESGASESLLLKLTRCLGKPFLQQTLAMSWKMLAHAVVKILAMDD